MHRRAAWGGMLYVLTGMIPLIRVAKHSLKQHTDIYTHIYTHIKRHPIDFGTYAEEDVLELLRPDPTLPDYSCKSSQSPDNTHADLGQSQKSRLVCHSAHHLHSCPILSNRSY